MYVKEVTYVNQKKTTVVFVLVVLLVMIVLFSTTSYSYATDGIIVETASETNRLIEKILNFEETQENEIENRTRKYSNAPIDELDYNSLFTVVDPMFPVIVNTKTFALEVIALVGTSLKIELYASMSLVAEEEKYISVEEPILLEIGSLERVWYEIKLKNGHNKIVISAICNEGKLHKEIIFVQVKHIEEIKELLTKERLDNTTFSILSNEINVVE